MTTSITTVTEQECWVIKVGKGYFAHRDWDCDTRECWVGTLDRDAARTFHSKAEAELIATEQRRDGLAARVLHRKAKTETTLTDEGRAQVAARRAARKAERGW